MLNGYSKFSIVSINDVLIYSKILGWCFKHLKVIFNIIKRNGLSVSTSKSTKIQFLGHSIFNGSIKLIQRSIKFAVKLKGEFKDENQFQKVVGFLNYVADLQTIISKIEENSSCMVS